MVAREEKLEDGSRIHPLRSNFAENILAIHPAITAILV